MTASYSTSRSSLLSILLPTRINGNFYGSLGAPWLRNYWIHDSMLSKDWIIYVIPSCWLYHRPKRINQLLGRSRLPDFWTFTVRRCPKSAGYDGMYLKINNFAVNEDFLFHEVSSDSGLVGLEELLINIPAIIIWVTSLGGRFCRHWIRMNNYAESPRMMTLDNFFLLIGL